MSSRGLKNAVPVEMWAVRRLAPFHPAPTHGSRSDVLLCPHVAYSRRGNRRGEALFVCAMSHRIGGETIRQRQEDFAVAAASTIALVSVIGTTSTAIAVPLINGWYAKRSDERRFANERRQGDLEERRALLDDCAQALTDYISATGSVMSRYAFADPKIPEALDLDFYMETLDKNIVAKVHAYALNRRLLIRLGRGREVVVAYSEALALLDKSTTEIATRIAERTGGKPDRRDEVIPFMDKLQASWDSAQDRFLDAATNLVGSP